MVSYFRSRSGSIKDIEFVDFHLIFKDDHTQREVDWVEAYGYTQYLANLVPFSFPPLPGSIPGLCQFHFMWSWCSSPFHEVTDVNTMQPSSCINSTSCGHTCQYHAASPSPHHALTPLHEATHVNTMQPPAPSPHHALTPLHVAIHVNTMPSPHPALTTHLDTSLPLPLFMHFMWPHKWILFIYLFWDH